MKPALMLLFGLVCASLGTAFAGGQDFTLVNRTGFNIHSVFLSPHHTEDWQEDLLGRDLLENGGAVDIKFERGEKTNDWDLKVVDKQGKGYVWQSLNVGEVAKVTVRYTDGNTAATCE